MKVPKELRDGEDLEDHQEMLDQLEHQEKLD